MHRSWHIDIGDAVQSSLGRDLRGDGPPYWRQGRRNRPQKSASEARRDRRTLIKALWTQRDGCSHLVDLVQRLADCSIAHPCGSGACPVCWRVARRVVMHASRHLFRERDRYRFVTGICAPEMVSAPRGLRQADPLLAVEHRLMAIARSGRFRVFGGLDLSLNSHHEHRFHPHYMPHGHWIVPEGAYDRYEDAWRDRFPTSLLVTKPLEAPRYDGRLRARAYALKPIEMRRVSFSSYITVDGLMKRANTKDRPLRRPERIELALLLDRIGLESRIIAYGYDTVTDGDDIWMVTVDKESADGLQAARIGRRAERARAHRQGAIADARLRQQSPFHL